MWLRKARAKFTNTLVGAIEAKHFGHFAFATRQNGSRVAPVKACKSTRLALKGNVPVAVLSGAVDIEQRAQALGAVASVAKPIDVEQLMDIVRRYCA